MPKTPLQHLSKRERQIMDVIYMLGEATAAEVLEHIPEEVGDASMRKLIRVVEQKGHISHRREGHSYVYFPTTPKKLLKSGESSYRATFPTTLHFNRKKIVAALEYEINLTVSMSPVRQLNS